MNDFSSAGDVSGTIKIEGEKISVSLDQGVPVSGQGTVSWNIPTPLAGCATQSNVNSAYCGIVITASNSASTVAQAPVDGTRYTADPTVNTDLHAGDNINGALVVGAFYEGEQKGRGENLTTSLVLSDLESDGFYYVTAYAVDCQGRHHTAGMRAYAADYGDIPQPDNPSFAAVTLNGNNGALPTDGTNLTPGQIYDFEFDLNTNFPADSTEANRIVVEVDGADAQTYGDLVDAINDQLTDLDNPFRSPIPPNAGSVLWNDDEKVLSEFDGISYSPITDAIIADAIDPTLLPDGTTYWFDINDMQFQQRNASNTANGGWDDFTTIIHPTDPSKPLCDEVWFNGTDAYKWSGTTWCELQFFEQELDPSLRTVGTCGEYWYNSESSDLFELDHETQAWQPSFAIVMPIAPNAIPRSFFWYDETNEVIRERRDVGANLEWVPRTELDSAVGNVTPTLEVAPQAQLVGFVWYDRVADIMYEFNGSDFIIMPDNNYVAWPTDPTDTQSCTLWWNDTISPEELREFDVLTNTWQLVSSFTNSPSDPLNPPVIEECAVWNDLTTNTIKSWNGSFFEEFAFIDYPSDPRNLDPSESNPDAPNTAWFNSTDSTWNIYTLGDPLPPTWNIVEPIVGDEDPTQPAVGQYWFDDATDILYQRSAINTWNPEPFTIRPVMNTIGTLWFDINDDTLKEWNGSAWVPADPLVSASLDNSGNLVFQTRETGSCVSLLMLTPGFSSVTDRNPQVTTRGPHSGGFLQTYTDDPFDVPQFLETSLSEDGFLFDALDSASVQPVEVGSDGLRAEPSYAQLGVGTDGSEDERRELAHSIRVQLGYPTIDVELTAEQLDLAITGAFESLRKRSDIAYRREFYMLDTRPGVQRYALTNRKANFHKIVSIMGAHRRSGALGGGFSSNSVFDQLFTNQLFGNTTAGGFDLTSLHLSQQYLEQVEIMFATRLNFHFSEHDRVLHFHQNMNKQERILLDATIDRTEQDMLKDRFIKSWIERHALAASRLTLSEIRGKYGTLPGAGGGVSLNASDLAAQAREDFADCYSQLDSYIAAQNEMYGAWDLVIG